MTRVKGAKTALKRRRDILKRVKGFKWGRSTKERQAREALMHAGERAFGDRRKKKGAFRRLWQTRINASVRPHGYSYSKFIGDLKKKGIELDRKVLSEIAKDRPKAFERVVGEIKKRM